MVQAWQGLSVDVNSRQGRHGVMYTTRDDDLARLGGQVAARYPARPYTHSRIAAWPATETKDRIVVPMSTNTSPSDTRKPSSHAARVRAMRTNCSAGAAAAENLPPQQPSLDGLAEFLRTVTSGRNASFASSLASYYDKHGTLTAKQTHYALQMYTVWRRREIARIGSLLEHDWQYVGSETHYSNNVLGTYSGSDFYRCTKCGVDGERVESNNYSGD